MSYGFEIRRPDGTKLISTDNNRPILGQVSAGTATGFSVGSAGYRYTTVAYNAEGTNLPDSSTFKFIYFRLPVGASLIKGAYYWVSNQTSLDYVTFDFSTSFPSNPDSHGLELFSSSGTKIWDSRFPTCIIKEQIYVANPLALPTFTVPSNADWYDVNGSSFRFIDGLYPQCFAQEFGIIRNSSTQIGITGSSVFYPPACDIGTIPPQPFSFLYATTPTL
jgi:hypothetical protein